MSPSPSARSLIDRERKQHATHRTLEAHDVDESREVDSGRAGPPGWRAQAVARGGERIRGGPEGEGEAGREQGVQSLLYAQVQPGRFAALSAEGEGVRNDSNVGFQLFFRQSVGRILGKGFPEVSAQRQ